MILGKEASWWCSMWGYPCLAIIFVQKHFFSTHLLSFAPASCPTQIHLIFYCPHCSWFRRKRNLVYFLMYYIIYKSTYITFWIPLWIFLSLSKASLMLTLVFPEVFGLGSCTEQSSQPVLFFPVRTSCEDHSSAHHHLLCALPLSLFLVLFCLPLVIC